MVKGKFVVFIGIVLCLITACAKPESKIEVYTVSGENDEIAINNGLLIVTDASEKFIGGELSFKNEELVDVKEYVETFFFYNEDGYETVILRNSSTITGAPNGQSINTDTGSISSEELFYGSDLDLAKQSLNFSLSGTLTNSESFDYELHLDVQQAY